MFLMLLMLSTSKSFIEVEVPIVITTLNNNIYTENVNFSVSINESLLFSASSNTATSQFESSFHSVSTVSTSLFPIPDGFNLSLGENVIVKVEDYCVKINLYNSCSISILKEILKLLKLQFHVNLKIHYIYDEIINSNDDNTHSKTINYISDVDDLCPNEIYKESNECYEIQMNALKSCWDYIEGKIRETYLLKYIRKNLINNENVLFIVDIPADRPIGMGNVMKALITFLSIHNNTKLAILPGSIFGDFSTILEHSHIFTSYDNVHEHSPLHYNQHQKVFTWDWLLLKDEELHFHKMMKHDLRTTVHMFQKPYLNLDNALLRSYFCSIYTIDYVFDRASLPTPVVKRILQTITEIKFQSHILQQSYALSDMLIAPALGVTVRSWSAVHETNTVVNRPYNQSAYEQSIRELVNKYEIRSVLIAFDNPTLLQPQFQPFLDSLGIPVYSYDESLSTSSLDKPAIEMLALSRTRHLLGDAVSTFLHTVYWFGECKQMVHHPYPNYYLNYLI